MKKQISMLLIVLMLLSTFNISAYAALIPEEPDVSVTTSNGIKVMTIGNSNSNPDTMDLVYSLNGTDWYDTTFDYGALPDGDYNFHFKFIVGTLDSITDESSVETYSIKNENTEVKAIKDGLNAELSKTVIISNYESIQSALDGYKTRIDALSDADQKSYLNGLATTLQGNINTFVSNNGSAIVNAYIDGLSSGMSLSQEESVKNKIEALDSVGARTTSMEHWEDALKDFSYYDNNSLDYITSDLNNSFDKFYYDDTHINVDKYITGVIDDDELLVYVLFSDTSSNDSKWTNLPYGEYQTWIQGTVLEYLQNHISSSYDVRVRLYGSDMKHLAELNYTSTEFRDGYEEIRNASTSASDNFEYLTFSNNIFTDDGDVHLVLKGDFKKTDSDWKSKNSLNFNDWLTYEVAEPVVNELEKDVIIKVLDSNGDSVYSKTISKSSVTNTSSKYSSLASKLNSNYDEIDEFKFHYVLNGSTSMVNVKMTGENFREVYDEWQEFDKTILDDWIRQTVGHYIISETEADLRVRIFDKNDVLITTYDLDSSDYIAKASDVEEHLNDNFYKQFGTYFDFDLTKNSSSMTLKINVDTKYTDDEWKDIDKAEFDKWIKSVANYTIDQIPKDINITVYDENHRHLKSYNFDSLNFGAVYDFEEMFNEETVKYENFKFFVELDQTTSEIKVYLRGSNFDYNDTDWKGTLKTSDFKAWLNESIVDKVMDEFNKSIRLYIYDEDNRSVYNKSYSKTYKTQELSSEISDAKNYLNNNARYMKLDDDNVYMSYTSSVQTYSSGNKTVTLTAKMNQVDDHDRVWEERNKAKVRGFLNSAMYVVDREISADNVTIKVKLVDKNGKQVQSETWNNDMDILGTLSQKFYSGTHASVTGYYLSYSDTYSLNNLLFELVRDKIVKIEDKNIVVTPTGNIAKIVLSDDDVKEMNKLDLGLIISWNKAHFEIPVDGKTKGFDVTISKTDFDVPYGFNFAGDLYKIETPYSLNATMYLDDTGSHSQFGIYKTTSMTPLNGGKDSSSMDASLSQGSYVLLGKGATFSDISGSKYKSEITKLSNEGIVNGVGNGEYNPFATLTRAEFTTMLVNGLKLDTSANGAGFGDVKTSDWYYDTVMTAQALNLVDGWGGNFHPDATISRQEIMTILSRTKDVMGLTFNVNNTPVDFANADEVDSWAIPYVSEMKQLGVLDNTSTSIGAKSSPNRDETAMYIYRFLKNSNRIQ